MSVSCARVFVDSSVGRDYSVKLPSLGSACSDDQWFISGVFSVNQNGVLQTM